MIHGPCEGQMYCPSPDGPRIVRRALCDRFSSQGNFEEVAVFLVESGADPNDVYTDDKAKQHNLLFDSVTLGNEVRLLAVLYYQHSKMVPVCS